MHQIMTLQKRYQHWKGLYKIKILYKPSQTFQGHLIQLIENEIIVFDLKGQNYCKRLKHLQIFLLPCTEMQGQIQCI